VTRFRVRWVDDGLHGAAVGRTLAFDEDFLREGFLLFPVIHRLVD